MRCGAVARVGAESARTAAFLNRRIVAVIWCWTIRYGGGGRYAKLRKEFDDQGLQVISIRSVLGYYATACVE